MTNIAWGFITLFLFLISIGCMAGDHWIAGMIFFGLGVLTSHGCGARGSTLYIRK
jgi:hypothetical protein